MSLCVVIIFGGSSIYRSINKHSVKPFSSNSHKSQFSGAFSRFPIVSELPNRHKRLTLIVQWLHDDIQPSLRGFLNSAQYNADVLDVLFINRIVDPTKNCLNFEKEGIDITWGGNIKHVCMQEEEWERRLTDFLCMKDSGWSCSEEQRKLVQNEIKHRQDHRGSYWRLFRGAMFRDLFIHPENPMWAWTDIDVTLGDMRHFPFSILSALSFVVADRESVDDAVLFGQFTAFNMDDENLLSCWKKVPTLRSPESFPQHVDTWEEQGWNYWYMGVDEGLPGRELSYTQISDAQLDDFHFDMNHESGEDQEVQFIFSGRDVLLSYRRLSRESIEELILLERDIEVVERGWYGWSTGYDGSDLMLRNPNMTQPNAYTINKDANTTHFHGKLETIKYHKGEQEGCSTYWIQKSFRLCYPVIGLAGLDIWGSVLRSSFVHFKDQLPGYLFQRSEIDSRPRAYNRALLKHSINTKNAEWGKMPPFDITKEHVLTISKNHLEVWKMGSDRNKTIYQRKENGFDSIG